MTDPRLLRIDLSRRSSEVVPIAPELIHGFIGGRGLGARLLYELSQPNSDPLSPENPLIFVAGPLSGSGAHFSPKSVLVTKSPLTGLYLYSVASGGLSAEIRQCGFWALVIVGAAERPTWLEIRDELVYFRDAQSLWGLTTTHAQAAMRRESGTTDLCTVVIGPAGEHLVKYAAVVTEGHRSQTFARGGAGAVMGSKHLKGLAIKGAHALEPRDPREFERVQSRLLGLVDRHERRTGHISFQRLYGTAGDVQIIHALGILPVRNFQRSTFPDLPNIAPFFNRESWVTEDLACGDHCPAPCTHFSTVRDGPYAGTVVHGPETDTVTNLGSCCEISRYDAILAANHLCDELGLDTMSVGLVISFAMECFEKKLLSPADTDGFQLRFGDDQAVMRLIPMIAYRRSIGDLLAEGSRHASEVIGQNSSHFAMQCKGMELAGYDPRGVYAMAIQYAVSNRGGCHHDLGNPSRVEYSSAIEYGLQHQDEMRTHRMSLEKIPFPIGDVHGVEGKGRLVRDAALVRIVYDSSILCTMSRFLGIETVAELISSVSMSSDVKDLSTAAERVLHLERLFNVREGIRREHDKLPHRLTEEPMSDGRHKGATVPIEPLKDDFYRAVGWDVQSGIPLLAALERVGLPDLLPAGCQLIPDAD